MDEPGQAGPQDLSLSELYSLRDRVAVVTGGGGGMGLAAVQRLGEAGARVVVVDIDQAAAEAAAKRLAHGQAIAVGADVSSEADTMAYVRSAVQAFGRIDCFFSNAGSLGPPARLLDSTLDAWHQIMGVNLLGAYLGLREVGRQMALQGKGSIVVTSSNVALRSSPGSPIYAAAKAGVISLVRSAAKDLGPKGVRINAICPAATMTNFSAALRGENPERLEYLKSRIPLGRVAMADDMARVATWLLSDSAAYVNGVIMPVDGGQEA
jgi:NAD(P)-dependent dehydrogenase (short-subunit alcohol dehydrogenase family)